MDYSSTVMPDNNIGISDIRDTLGVNSNHLATLCRSGSVNPYAAHSPLSHHYIVVHDPKQVFGLTPFTTDVKTPYSIGNFRGYWHKAPAPFNTIAPMNTAADIAIIPSRDYIDYATLGQCRLSTNLRDRNGVTLMDFAADNKLTSFEVVLILRRGTEIIIRTLGSLYHGTSTYDIGGSVLNVTEGDYECAVVARRASTGEYFVPIDNPGCSHEFSASIYNQTLDNFITEYLNSCRLLTYHVVSTLTPESPSSTKYRVYGSNLLRKNGTTYNIRHLVQTTNTVFVVALVVSTTFEPYGVITANPSDFRLRVVSSRSGTAYIKPTFAVTDWNGMAGITLPNNLVAQQSTRYMEFDRSKTNSDYPTGGMVIEGGTPIVLEFACDGLTQSLPSTWITNQETTFTLYLECSIDGQPLITNYQVGQLTVTAVSR